MIEACDVSKDPKFSAGVWVRDSEAGDTIIYHIGFNCGGKHRKLLYDASEAGRVILFQRRDKKNRMMFQYHARRLRGGRK